MIRRSPQFQTGYSSLGGLLVLRGDYGAAIDTLKLSIALRPDNVAFSNLGTAYFNSGRLEQAIDAYNQALQFGFADNYLVVQPGRCVLLAARPARSGDGSVRAGHPTGAPGDGRPLPAGTEVRRPDPGEHGHRLPQARSARTAPGSTCRPRCARTARTPMVQCNAALALWQLGDHARAIGWLERSVQGG
jgi:tetratricopeptide (TPR) repeat protein